MSCGKINANIGTECLNFQNFAMDNYVELINKSIADSFKDCDYKLCRIDNHVNHIECFYQDKYFAKITWGHEDNTGELGFKFVVTTTFV